MAESAALLVDEVLPAQPVLQWVLSVPYALRFLFANEPAIMGAVLGIVHRCLAAHLIGKAGLSRKRAQTGAVTLIQRFGGALNLNVHFHMLVLDGVYVERPDGTLRFRRVAAPTSAELNDLTTSLAHRIGRFLERRGLIERDAENAWLVGDDDVEAAALLRPSGASNCALPRSPMRCQPSDAGGTDRAQAAQRDRLHPEGIEAQRLRRVFGIDIERCAACGGRLRVIACIENRDVIETILAHLRRRTSGSSGSGSAAQAHGPPCRAPPSTSPLG